MHFTHLLLLAAPVIAIPAPNYNPFTDPIWTCPGVQDTNATVPTTGKTYNLRCWSSIQGPEIRRFYNPGPSMLPCAAACSEDPTCVGANYFYLIYECVLYKHIDAINLGPYGYTVIPV
jgi:hypothetical protein